MLISFRVNNFRSIGEDAVLSLEPVKKVKEYQENILTKAERFHALNVAVIYGANASGKSNVIKAMKLMDKMIFLSFKNDKDEKLKYEPFLLREGWDEKPTEMELVFVVDDTQYRYGFTYTQKQIEKEWLFRRKTGRAENPLFLREGETLERFGDFKKESFGIGQILLKNTALYLSIICRNLEINQDDIEQLNSWLTKLSIGFGEGGLKKTYELLKNDHSTVRITLEGLKLSFSDLRFIEKDIDEVQFPEELLDDFKGEIIKQIKKNGSKFISEVKTIHHFYDNEGKSTEEVVELDLWEHESTGSEKMIYLLGIVIKTLNNGGVLAFDELEANLHPHLSLYIINLFLHKHTNPNGAQLIFTTHDTNLLSTAKLRRDQIYFTEKNKWESTELYSISDMPANDRIEENYLRGRYGAIPYLGLPPVIRPLDQSDSSATQL